MTRRGLLIAMISASGIVTLSQKVCASAEQDKFAVANEDVKELLLLMDTDKSGKISKRE
jgi:hypothetical protein